MRYKGGTHGNCVFQYGLHLSSFVFLLLIFKSIITKTHRVNSSFIQIVHEILFTTLQETLCMKDEIFVFSL
jgi:hypothetical protein